MINPEVFRKELIIASIKGGRKLISLLIPPEFSKSLFRRWNVKIKSYYFVQMLHLFF